MKTFYGSIHTICAVCTAMIGYHIHRSVFWALLDYIFMPLVWIKWLVCEQVNVSIIKSTFAFFFH